MRSVSRAAKECQPKDQISTNVYLVLDRQFERSILRGLEDSKKGRLWTVPKGVDPVDFLDKLTSTATPKPARRKKKNNNKR